MQKILEKILHEELRSKILEKLEKEKKLNFPLYPLPFQALLLVFLVPYFKKGPLLLFAKSAKEENLWKENLFFWQKMLGRKIPIRIFPSAREKISIITPAVLQKALFVGSYLENMAAFFILPENFTEIALPHPKIWQKQKLELQIQEKISLANLRSRFLSLGYQEEQQALQKGFFAQRGGLLDIFPVNNAFPFRLEFVGDEIYQISFFDPLTEEMRGTKKKITVWPLLFKEGLFAKDYLRLPFAKTLINSSFPPGACDSALNFAPHGTDLKGLRVLSVSNYVLQPGFFRKDYAFWRKNQTQIILCGEKNRLIKFFQEQNLPFPPFFFSCQNPPFGWYAPEEKIVFLSEKNLLPEAILEPSPRKKIDLSFFSHLVPGDYVVHLDHGIGKYLGIKRRTIKDVSQDYILIEYAENDLLSIPITYADKVSKYFGKSKPILHRLGGASWLQLQRKAKEKTYWLAQELLEIYAKRKISKGFAFIPDSPQMEELVSSFSFEETPDQAKVWREIKRDLEKEEPMDRLLTGDVGFGKTEIAIRAAFKAFDSGYQTALLCPTTILAQQHFDTFASRLKNFPVKLGLLSRFQTKKEQKKTVEDLKQGKIDIVIGTHRLLSSDVKFKNLGLVIIDEEQRFGVRHKEKLKKFKANVHVLTLTATPIPRTLHLTLSDLKPLSVIETPPPGRLPVETKVLPYSEETIQKAVKKELERKGQVYFLHNQVETIAMEARKLQKLLPEAKIDVAHGQLPQEHLIKVMRDFDQGKINVLVCSTIIENGLDLPQVNTLIVNNAPQFGLADLYQLRGRIGRRNRQGYAYFLYSAEKIKPLAAERLQKLLGAKELGSGLQIALADMEMRGAGNILGKEQHGLANEIGLNLYLSLLSQTIEELKSGKKREPKLDVTVDLPLSAYLPQDLFPSAVLRMQIYRQLATIESKEDWEKIKIKILRKLPDLSMPAINLLYLAKIKLLCQKAQVFSIDTQSFTSVSEKKAQRIVLKPKEKFNLKVIPLKFLQSPHWNITEKEARLMLTAKINWQKELERFLKVIS